MNILHPAPRPPMRRLSHAAVPVLIAMLAAAPALAQGGNPGASVPALTPAQEAAVETVVARWIADHPAAVRRAIDPVRAAGVDDPDDVTAGNPAGDVSLVAFIDRGSPSGPAAVTVMMALVATDPGLRIVIKELPLLSQASVEAASVAFAAHRQGGKAALAFESVMTTAPAGGASARAAAERAGLDPVRLTADASGPEARSYLRRTRELAGQLGIRAAPTFLVGTHAMVGLRGPDELREAILAARSVPPPG